VTRALAVIAVVLSAAALAVALAAYQRAGNQPAGVLSDASVRQLRHEMSRQRLTRDDVRR
jgi:hypothetical protein